jgi:hypothetical protein
MILLPPPPPTHTQMLFISKLTLLLTGFVQSHSSLYLFPITIEFNKICDAIILSYPNIISVIFVDVVVVVVFMQSHPELNDKTI